MSNYPGFTKLQPRQRKYLEGLALGKTKKQALDYAGYSPNSGSSRIETASMKAAFARLMRRAAPAHVIAAKIAEGLEAKETKFFAEKGEVKDQREVVAWSERREYAKLAAQFGQYAETAEDQKVGGTQVNIIVEHIGPQDKVTAQAKPIVEVVGQS